MITWFNILQWLYIGAAVIIVPIVIYWIILPLNWVEDLTDVGFDTLIKNNRYRGHKASLIQRIQSRKKIGNIPPVYPNGWYALLESTNLSRGDVKYVAALGENFAVFRTNYGEAVVFDAYCPHMGANMAVRGIIRDNCLECPFHGWRFRAEDGKCVSIPYADKIPETAKVKKWTVREVNSFIFVWYHAENEAPNWFIEPIPEIANNKWFYRGRNEFMVNCHIQEIPENGPDVAHLDSIHSLPILSGSNSLIAPTNYLTWIIATFLKHSWTAKWEPKTNANHIATIRLKQDLKLLQKVSLFSIDGTVQQIGPSYVQMELKHNLGTMVVLQTILPEGPLLQRVIHRLYCPWQMYLHATFTLIGESILFKRDMIVWNHKKYLDKPQLVKDDGKIMQYRRWYSQFFSENSKRFERQDDLDW